MEEEIHPDTERVKILESRLRDLKRKHQELTWVYEERGLQIGRLEVALTRALEKDPK